MELSHHNSYLMGLADAFFLLKINVRGKKKTQKETPLQPYFIYTECHKPFMDFF